jgi:hypothetical protein
MHMVLPKPEQLIDLVGHAVVIKQAMEGEFDKQISALKEAQAALAEQNGIVKTLAQAERIRDAATADAESKRVLCEDAIAKANTTLTAALARDRAVTDRENEVGRREATVAKAAESLKQLKIEIDKRQSEQDADLKKREAKLVENERNHAAAAAKLAKDIAAFNARLESLKA